MRFAASALLPAGPLLLLLATALPPAVVGVTSDEKDEAELEKRIDSAIAEVASEQLQQERKYLHRASYHSDDYLRHRAHASFLKTLSKVDEDHSSSSAFWMADPENNAAEGATPLAEATKQQLAQAKPRELRHLKVDPVATEKAKRELAEELRYLRNVYLPSRRSARHPLHRASRLRRPHHLSALAKKPHVRGFIGREKAKLAEAVSRLHRAHNLHFRRQGRYGYGHSGLDRLRRRRNIHHRRSNPRRSFYRFQHRRPRASLTAAAVTVSPKTAPADTEKVPASPPSDSHDVFPKSHPIVQRALGSMDGELKLLRGHREAAMKQSTEVEDYVQKAHDGMKVGAAIRRKIAAAKADVVDGEQLVGRIQSEQLRLKDEHATIETKLHKAMDPRISLRDVLVKKKKHDLEKIENDVQKWTSLSEKKKVSALEMIRQRKLALGELKDAEEALKEAAHKEEMARKSYEEAKKSVNEQVQSLNVFETKLRAAKSMQETEEEAASEAESSLDRTQGILKVELSRLDQALSSGEERLGARLAKAQRSKAKAERKLAEAKTGYAAWEKEQHELADAAAKEVGAYENQQNAFNHDRDDMLRAAAAKAGAQAAAESAWDDSDWAWSGGIDGAEPDDDWDF